MADGRAGHPGLLRRLPYPLRHGTGQGRAGFTEADLADGYAIMHRDAVATAVWAARRDAADKAASNAGRGNAVAISELPTSHDVHNAIFSLNVRRVPGASGAIYFREQPPNDRWPSGKPVPVIRIGALVSHWTSPATYVTE